VVDGVGVICRRVKVVLGIAGQLLDYEKGEGIWRVVYLYSGGGEGARGSARSTRLGSMRADWK
jgi:hypothetical protein